MRFLIDAQLPPALAVWLSAKGHDARHVVECDMQAASDTAIWDYALSIGASIVTKDEDFAQRKIFSRSGPSIVWIRIPNTRRRELLEWFETALPHIVAALDNCETLIEVV